MHFKSFEIPNYCDPYVRTLFIISLISLGYDREEVISVVLIDLLKFNYFIHQELIITTNENRKR